MSNADITHGRWVLLRAALVDNVAMHDARCHCVICRAYYGDEEAVADVWQRMEDNRREEANRR